MRNVWEVGGCGRDVGMLRCGRAVASKLMPLAFGPSMRADRRRDAGEIWNSWDRGTWKTLDAWHTEIVSNDSRMAEDGMNHEDMDGGKGKSRSTGSKAG
ncbi:hypothetical protein CTA2_12242 [Colletotrichum tanaceti]|uniref:Uncharacterized protein n=1 Tax=Colletotrichum tanaceti TaxID=1306861 RepID=A0A4U6XLF7_9PEZI|nr:hypothetical protein CTA2_12242 [Colletotrichum tanaceti]TKW56469.1 hypothetical protein CTA1_2146 [Colletotrichum tanaceti]